MLIQKIINVRHHKLFELSMIFIILFSALTVGARTYKQLEPYQDFLSYLDIFITVIFLIEIVIRYIAEGDFKRFVRDPWNLFDTIIVVGSLIPLESSNLVFVGRLLRIFRVFKLARYIGEAAVLQKAFMQSKTRIIVFLSTVFVLCAISGAGMYMVEGPESGFTSIPQSVYWAIVTLTSTGYGDIVPITTLGKIIAVFIMIMGYSLIIVPTGIMTTELVRIGPVSTQACISCSKEGHDTDAKYCKFCGAEL